MSEKIMGRPGEYREQSLEELEAKFGQHARDFRALALRAESRDTATIADKFAEALGHIEDAAHLLGQVNEQYDPDQGIDYTRPSNPALDFWLQADLAEDAIKPILSKLRCVEPLAPKEVVV